MSAAKRKVYGAAFKGKVGLEAIRGLKTINEIAQEYATRRTWIAPNPSISIQRQCHLAGVAGATVYAQRPEKPLSSEDKMLMDLLDAQYTATPFL